MLEQITTAIKGLVRRDEPMHQCGAIDWLLGSIDEFVARRYDQDFSVQRPNICDKCRVVLNQVLDHRLRILGATDCWEGNKNEALRT
jgi:hypothetical protein